MPQTQTLEKFIARVEENAHAEAIAEFYAPDASIQENQSEPRVGRDGLVESEKRFLSTVRSVQSTCVRPVFVSGDHVVIRWLFQFEFLDGRTMRMEELAYQRWVGESISAETFFYDPAQRTPQ